MATGWVRALHCRSDDVHPSSPQPPTTLSSLSCRATLRDAIFARKKPKPKPTKPHKRVPPAHLPSPSRPPAASPFPTLTELPPRHSSRRVVELIFSSSWPPLSPPADVHGLFRLHHTAAALRRFEDYRRAVRSRAGDDARCAADGNETMRFRPAYPWPEPKAYSLPGGIRTFSGSAGAHRSASAAAGGGRSKAMLLCRVIAGRVRPGSDCGSDCGFESVDVGKGELVVFDPRAVLPCFLIIYKV